MMNFFEYLLDFQKRVLLCGTSYLL